MSSLGDTEVLCARSQLQGRQVFSVSLDGDSGLSFSRLSLDGELLITAKGSNTGQPKYLTSGNSQHQVVMCFFSFLAHR